MSRAGRGTLSEWICMLHKGCYILSGLWRSRQSQAPLRSLLLKGRCNKYCWFIMQGTEHVCLKLGRTEISSIEALLEEKMVTNSELQGLVRLKEGIGIVWSYI